MSERDPLVWWAYVESDLLNIEASLAYPRVAWDTVAYHAQQAAEKALKAIIIARGGRLERTHDVAQLLRDVQRLTALDSALMPACESLTELGLISRYPDDAGFIAEADARQAVVYAREVVGVARKALLSFGIAVP